MKFEIRGVGDKIKEMRKSLNAKQDELVSITSEKGGNKTFTRNLVSMVETGKAPLTKKLAECIVLNVNRICEERGINEIYDFEEIFKTPEEQIREYVSNFLNNINDAIGEDESVRYMEDLVVIAEKYELYDEIAQLYYSQGKKCISCNLTKAERYYIQAYSLKNYLSSQQQISSALNLKKIFINKRKFKEAIAVKFDRYNENEELVIKCMFNDILSKSYLKDYDNIFQEIENLCTYNINDRIKGKLDSIKALTYKNTSDYKKAFEAFDLILKKNVSVRDRAVTLANIIDLKMELNLEFLNDLNELDKVIQDYHKNSDKEFMIEIYETAAKGFEKINSKRSEEYYRFIMEKNLKTDSSKEIFSSALNIMIDLVMDSKENLDQKLEEIQMNLISGIEKSLVTEAVLMKALYLLQVNKKYDVVENLLSKSVS